MPPRPGANLPNDKASITYIDRFGNAMTGLRASLVDHSQVLSIECTRS
jgi:S-adenosylmethionine hydrolase